MFLLKKIISGFLLPLSLLLGLMGLGLIMLFAGRRQSLGRKIIALSFLALVLTSYGVFSYWPLATLENIHPPVDLTSVRPMRIGWVVVLAGNNEETYVRLAEGIRIHRALPGTKLLVSGGKVMDAAPETSSSRMARIASGLGVNPGDIVQENLSRDTGDEARIVHSMVGEAPIVLVTSAYHMHRSMILFEEQGMHPVAAPVGYRTLPEERYLSPGSLFPDAGNLVEAEIVLHEVLGILSVQILRQLEDIRP